MQHSHKQQGIPRFMQRQYEFAARIRDPERAPAPADVAPQRMRAYEELFYNNINECLSNAFPVLRKIHDDTHWHALLRDYFARHRARTPLFHEMPREFVHYLQQERGEREGDYPFLLELAHYEWIELELLTAEESLPEYDTDGDLLDGIPMLSPLTRLLNYYYPVHQIGPDNIPEKPCDVPTHLLVYRNLADAIGFIELNPVTARLLQLLGEEPDHSGRKQLVRIATELNHPHPQTVITGGQTILAELHHYDIILGSRAQGAAT